MAELVVVLALFVIVIDASVTIFISIVNQQKRLLQEQQFINQGSYIIEYMSKQLRAAVQDETGDCLGLGYEDYIYVLTDFNSQDGFFEGVTFLTQDNVCQQFFLDANDGVLKEIKDGAAAQPILSAYLNIEDVRFVANGDPALDGALADDVIQPRLTFSFKIILQTDGQAREKVIQTTVSQRNINALTGGFSDPGNPVCGNLICEVPETPFDCPADCSQGPSCGNLICEAGETPLSCPADCSSGATCGNGICEIGENPATCLADCS